MSFVSFRQTVNTRASASVIETTLKAPQSIHGAWYSAREREVSTHTDADTDTHTHAQTDRQTDPQIHLLYPNQMCREIANRLCNTYKTWLID
mmetsp:Transcript_41690/g.118324  ORF Transcript_41690/g.118324 Transcript_41690/m.118324 type:complete len:92 (-) Transcript_41690:124-399(-)